MTWFFVQIQFLNYLSLSLLTRARMASSLQKHWRALANMYHAAPINQFFKARLSFEKKGEAILHYKILPEYCVIKIKILLNIKILFVAFDNFYN